jgi:hypothetical protein
VIPEAWIPAQTLTDANAKPRGASSTAHAGSQAWEREMERARQHHAEHRMSDRLRSRKTHGVAVTPLPLMAPSLPAALAARQMAPLSSSLSLRPIANGSQAPSLPTGERAPPRSGAAGAPALFVPPPASAPTEARTDATASQRPMTDPCGDARRVAQAVRSACGVHEPVRLHVQWEGDTASIWLGLDATSAQRLPHIAQALSRWLGGIGMRLRSLVCNGQAHVERGAPASDPSSALRPLAIPTAADEGTTFIDIVAERNPE